jgi:MOSC domain-containing protein YiiM
MMRLLSVNVGMPVSHVIDGRQVTTGVFKWPVPGPVHIGRLGAAGDGQGSLATHGGPDQALSAYSTDHYRHWRERFDRADLTPGIFGENLTVENMSETAVCIGDRFAIGSAVVEVTHPRIPCFRLSHRLGLPLFHDEQLASGRIGYLLRVVREGEIAAGDRVELIERETDPVTVAQCIAATLLGQDLPDVLRRLDRMPLLSAKWRVHVSARLAAAEARAGV